MEANIINLERYQDKETLTTLVLKFTKQININHIYLIATAEDSKCHYRFIIIIEDMAKRFKQRVKEILAELLETSPNCTAHFFTLHDIHKSTSEGNTFFINHCTRDTLFYYHSHYNENWLFHNVELTEIIQKAKENFLKQEEKIQGFKDGAELFLKKKNYGQAAFMLHQTIEHGFLAAEYFLMGKTFTGHLISDHQLFLGNVMKEFGKIFPRETEADTNLLNKLNRSYCDSRYTLNYHIKKKQVLEIKRKAENLIEIVKKYVEAEFCKCESLLKVKSQSRPLENANTHSGQKINLHNGQKINYNEMEGEPELICQMRELAEKNFLTMAPIKGGRSGYYLKYARIYDYFDLICLLQSTINVCILALEDTQDCTLDIKNKESDVKAVLNFAKNLIPLEEANFLDKMRELLLNNEQKL